MTKSIRIAALLSGGGRTLMNLVDRIDDARLAARIDTVISSRPDAAGVERARARGFKVEIAEDGDGGVEIRVMHLTTLWVVNMLQNVRNAGSEV